MLENIFKAQMVTAAPQALVANAERAYEALPAVHIGLVVFFIILILLVLAVSIVMVVSLWKVYLKAGKRGWASIVPVYSLVVLFEITNLPLWWIILMPIPFVNLVLSAIMLRRLAVMFGKGWGYTIGLWFLPFVFYPMLAFSSASYNGRAYPPATPMSETVRWTLLGVLALGVFEILMLSFIAGPQARPLSIISAPDSYSYYATDGTYVYVNDQVVLGADPETFRVEGDYAYDRNTVYYSGTVISQADARTFAVQSGSYASDAGHVYYAGEVLKNANPTSFQVIDYQYARDLSQVYCEGRVVDGADANSFTVLDSDYTGYVADATHVYLSCNAVQGADRATFVVESGTIGKIDYDAKDAKHYYSYGEMVK